MKVFYFTSTGNCLDVAKRIGGELYSIPKVLKDNTLEFEDEAIGIIFPTYAWSVPVIVSEFLEKVKLKAKYVFAIATYGNIDGGVTNHIVKLGKDNGLNINYVNSLLMVDNVVKFFEMEDQVNKLDEKKTEENLTKIVNDIKNRKEEFHTGNILKAGFSNLTYKMQKISVKSNHKQFIVQEHCTACKTCVNVCPVANITIENNRPKYDSRCIGCLGCTHNCPINAIRVKGEKSKKRFRNKEVKLKDIIDSNNQF